MTTVFVLLSDVRFVLFTLACSLLHLAAARHEHMTCRIFHIDTHIYGLFTGLQLWFLDARLQICVRITTCGRFSILLHAFPRGAVRICKCGYAEFDRALESRFSMCIV